MFYNAQYASSVLLISEPLVASVYHLPNTAADASPTGAPAGSGLPGRGF